MKKSYVTVTDQFCGAGGSSLGAKQAGAEIRLALNHWKLAIETHNTNFPNTDHDCTDISAVDPRRYPSTDVLITSPECTNHSIAKGKKQVHYEKDLFGNILIDPSEERSRATMWDVPRFAEYHDYNLIVVENVVDARKWRLWDSWIHAMTALNYEHEVVYYNSMFAWPTPQSRDRMYGVFWKKGNRKPNLDFYPPAPCSVCQKNVGGIQTWKKRKRWGKYGTLESKQGQYFYRCPYCHNEVIPYFFAAFNAIDWSIQAERIGDRKRPLKPKTLERIKYGLERYGRKPLIISPRYNQGIGSRVHDASIEAFPTQLTEATHAVAMPWFIRTSHTQGNGMYTHGPVNPGFTQTTRQDIGIVGFLSKQYGGKADPKHVNLGLDDVLGTVTTWDHHAFISLAPGFLVRQNDSGSNPEKRSISLDRPLATVLSDDTHAFVEIPPSFIAELHGTSKAAGVDEPLMCITGGGGHHAILNTDAFLAYYYGTQNASGIADPLNTLTATDRAGLVEILDSIKVEDLTFRMLQPHEIGTAMAFPDSYTVLGTKRDKVKQYGNAVTPPVMEMILERAIETL